MKSIFQYQDYRKFLFEYVKSQGKGAKLRLATAIEMLARLHFSDSWWHDEHEC